MRMKMFTAKYGDRKKKVTKKSKEKGDMVDQIMRSDSMASDKSSASKKDSKPWQLGDRVKGFFGIKQSEK